MREGTESRTIGVVLAGGMSTRMGQSKASLELGGEPLLRRVVSRLSQAVSDLLVIGQAELQALVPGVTISPDLRLGLGPLAGLESAVHYSIERQSTHVFLAACDMPFVSPQLARYMSELAHSHAESDVVLLHSERGPEYLHAVYSASCLPVVQRRLDHRELSLRALIDELRVLEVSAEKALPFDPHGLSAFNANTPQEWVDALAIAESNSEL